VLVDGRPPQPTCQTHQESGHWSFVRR
jgi:hypothetical protein